MSAATPDAPTSPPPPPPLAPGPTSSAGSTNGNQHQQPKRSLFGLKKKSTQSLGAPSSPSNTLASAGSSLKSGGSVESLDKASAAFTGSTVTATAIGGGGAKGVEGGGGVKKRKGVFGRKVKSDSGGASFTSIEEDKDNEGGGGSSKGGGGVGDSLKGNGKERGASEDDRNSLLYDSDEDV